MTGIVENARDVRLSCGLTQKQLAKKMGITQQSIPSIEAERSTQNLYTLLLIAKALNMKLTVFYS